MKKILNITNGDCARTRENFCANFVPLAYKNRPY